jgi:adenine specific DNA methylase Mod
VADDESPLLQRQSRRAARDLRESIRDQSVDLIYLDPPFNSNATYNVLFRAPSGEASQAQIEAFEDTWHWNDAAERALRRDAVGQRASGRHAAGAALVPGATTT